MLKLFLQVFKSIANAKIQHYEILIIDECHLVAPNESGQYHALISKLKVNPDLKDFRIDRHTLPIR